MERWKNYGLWLSLFSLTYLVLSDMGIIVDAMRYELYIDTVMAILVFLGIVSNPDTGKWYKDK